MVRCKAKTFEPVTKVNQNGSWGSAARAIKGTIIPRTGSWVRMIGQRKRLLMRERV
jgi:hypothetical protein